MARTASRRKSTRTAAAERSARTLARNAARQAEGITLRVLEGGRSLAVRPAGQTGRLTSKRRRGKAGTLAQDQAVAAAVATPVDVTPKMAKAAAAFGDVLRSIGHAVAVTQTALDETALESLKTLAGQSVDVPVLVEQTLTKNGTPDSVQIITAPMPLTSIITPSMQQVDQMTLRMDMRVESFSAASGIKFNQNIASAGVSYSGHSFGFAVAMNNTNVNAQFSNMSDFSSGSVMMSMDIVDRTGFTIPKPLEYGIGANILLRLKEIKQTPAANPDDGFERVAKVGVKLVQDTGAAVDLSGYTPTLPPGLMPDTNTAGELKITRICATAAEPHLDQKVQIAFGQLSKEISFFL